MSASATQGGHNKVNIANICTRDPKSLSCPRARRDHDLALHPYCIVSVAHDICVVQMRADSPHEKTSVSKILRVLLRRCSIVLMRRLWLTCLQQIQISHAVYTLTLLLLAYKSCHTALLHCLHCLKITTYWIQSPLTKSAKPPNVHICITRLCHPRSTRSLSRHCRSPLHVHHPHFFRCASPILSLQLAVLLFSVNLIHVSLSLYFLTWLTSSVLVTSCPMLIHHSYRP